MRAQSDVVLHHVLAACPKLQAAGGSVATGLTYGIVLSLGAHALGLWSFVDGRYVFRGLANYEPLYEATTLDDAHQHSITLLQSCRNGWAERAAKSAGPVNPIA